MVTAVSSYGIHVPPSGNGYVRTGLCRADEFETDAPALLRFVPVVADDAEGTDFCCVGHVRTDAEAFVVVAYLHYAHRLRSIVGQALQVETAAGLLLRDEFRGDVQVSADDFVHSLLFFRSMWADTDLPHPKRRIMVWLMMCSQVCIGAIDTS